VLQVSERGRGEGRVPTLMAVVIGSEAYESNFFSFIFLVCWAFGINKNVIRFASISREKHLGNFDFRKEEGRLLIWVS
jgi:hypothetical protein